MSSKDVQKQRAWEARLARYRASGLSVSRFCREEDVSVHTFYYWTKRLEAASSPTRSRAGRRSLPQASTASATLDGPQGALVRFRGIAGVEVLVPAECLRAIRCLARCLTGADGRRGEAFQEIVVKS
jgi:hypothetical protein